MDSSLLRTAKAFPDTHQNAYLGNGMIGYRVRPNPFASWKAAASGFVGVCDPGGFDILAYAPYPFAMDFRLGDSPSMLERPDEIRVISQHLDMSCGELTSELEAPLGGGIARMSVLQFVSRTCPVISC